MHAPVLVLLAAAGCVGTDLPPDHASATAARAPLVLELHVAEPPREAVVEVLGPDGARVVERACTFDGRARPPACARIAGWRAGRGEHVVRVRSVAEDGIAESAEARIVVHGDELRARVRGSFDRDGSLGPIEVRTLRRGADGLEVIADRPGVAGEPPRMMLVQGAAAPIEVHVQDGHVLSDVVRVDDDGAWIDVPRITAGCGTGIEAVSLAPGRTMLVGEVYAIGGTVPLPVGRYLVVVGYDDHGVDRAVTAEITIAETRERLEPEIDEVAERATFAEERWAGTPELPRPGATRPAGLEGGRTGATALEIGEGDVIAGVITADRGHHYRVRGVYLGQSVRVRLYARGPGLAFDYRARPDAAAVVELHRAAPAWSTLDTPGARRGRERPDAHLRG